MRLIDGDALLANVKHAVYTDDLSTTIAVGICESHIKDMPTIDAAPVKHGKWLPVLNGKDDDSNPAFDCSECDAMCRKQYNYCPRCGAKMDLEE